MSLELMSPDYQNFHLKCIKFYFEHQISPGSLAAFRRGKGKGMEGEEKSSGRGKGSGSKGEREKGKGPGGIFPTSSFFPVCASVL